MQPMLQNPSPSTALLSRRSVVVSWKRTAIYEVKAPLKFNKTFIVYHYKYTEPYNKQFVCKKVLKVHLVCFFRHLFVGYIPSRLLSRCSDWVRGSTDGFGGLVVSMLAPGSRVRGFKPGRSRWDFTSVKILSMPSFGGEVKVSVPCPSFAACKRN
jgi:hypothetical protein